MTARQDRTDAWADDDDEAGASVRPLTREEAARLRERDPPLSPWRVVAAQAAVGAGVALAGWLLTGRWELVGSALYGVAVVVIPGALLARGVTSRFSSISPAVSAVSVMLWEMVKIAVSVAMLVAAPRLVDRLSWPALLVGLAAGMSVYWFALLWRGRRKV
jgi:ATP synthase protein I